MPGNRAAETRPCRRRRARAAPGRAGDSAVRSRDQACSTAARGDQEHDQARQSEREQHACGHAATVATQHSNGENQHLSSARPAPDDGDELAAEQAYVTGLHRRLDDIRARVVAGSTTPWPAPRTTRRPSASARPTVQLYTRAPGRARRRRERAVLRPARPRATPTSPLRRPDRAVRPRTATRSRCWSTGGRPPPSRSTRPRRCTTSASAGAGTSAPAARTVVSLDDEVLDLDRSGRRPQRSRPGRRGGAAGRAERGPHRPDDRHRRAPSRPSRTAIIRADAPRRARRAGRPGHRQDRRRAAPRRLPALHPPGAAGPQRAC